MKTAASSPTSPRAMDTIKRSEARDVVHIHGDDVAMKKEPYEYCKQQDLSLRRIERVCASTLASKIHQKEVRSTHAKLIDEGVKQQTAATKVYDEHVGHLPQGGRQGRVAGASATA